MEYINLGTVIEQALARFGQNRIGDRPSVFVTISPGVPEVPWHDQSLQRFVRLFLYESLLTNDPDAPIEISVKRQAHLADLNSFVGMKPSYWAQLRVSGRGLKVTEVLIADLFARIGYGCKEWIGIEGASVRLGIFAPDDKPELKMVFGVQSLRHRLRCDLLLPASDVVLPAPQPATPYAAQATPSS